MTEADAAATDRHLQKDGTPQRPTIAEIAWVCHEANRAYCQTIGDDSQPPWEEAPNWQRMSALKGVQFHIDHPDADAAASHNSWLEEKRADGWTYGQTKDPGRKQHPCFVPFEQLPMAQQRKDFLFRAIVHALYR